MKEEAFNYEVFGKVRREDMMPASQIKSSRPEATNSIFLVVPFTLSLSRTSLGRRTATAYDYLPFSGSVTVSVSVIF